MLQLAIANPLVYQPGDVILIQLTISIPRRAGSRESESDSQAQILGLFRKHPTVLVCLRQRTHMLPKRDKGTPPTKSTSSGAGLWSSNATATAVSWPNPCHRSSDDDPTVSVNCEIKVPKDVDAGFELQDLAVGVSSSSDCAAAFLNLIFAVHY